MKEAEEALSRSVLASTLPPLDALTNTRHIISKVFDLSWVARFKLTGVLVGVNLEHLGLSDMECSR